MKAMTCEMCGSTNLIKQDGVYVCEHCGTKYSVEEAKKLLVEVSGTVKIDDTDELKNLYQVARTARSNANYELATNTYTAILVKDPSSWEATFYSFYCSTYNTKKGEVLSVAVPLERTVSTTANLICDSSMTDDEKYTALYEVANNTCILTETLAITEYGMITKKYDKIVDAHDLISTAFMGPAVALSKVIEAKCEKTERFEELTNALRLPVSSIGNHEWYDITNQKNLSTRNGGLEKGISAVKQGKASSKQSDGTYYPAEMKKSGGCYVATCVYGSYDCPQVWTLRRFRDDDLAATWYGRLFIHTYYAISPTIVKLFGNTDWFKRMWRGKLDKMVAELQKKGYEATPYEDKNW